MVVLAGELPGTLKIFSGIDAKSFVFGASITVSFEPLLRWTGEVTELIK